MGLNICLGAGQAGRRANNAAIVSYLMSFPAGPRVKNRRDVSRREIPRKTPYCSLSMPYVRLEKATTRSQESARARPSEKAPSFS